MTEGSKSEGVHPRKTAAWDDASRPRVLTSDNDQLSRVRKLGRLTPALGDISCSLPSLARSHRGHFPIHLAPLLPARQQHLIAPVSALAPNNPIVEANHATDYAVNANFIARLWIDSGIAGGHNNLSFRFIFNLLCPPFSLIKELPPAFMLRVGLNRLWLKFEHRQELTIR
jgi:hypothetical protein